MRRLHKIRLNRAAILLLAALPALLGACSSGSPSASLSRAAAIQSLPMPAALARPQAHAASYVEADLQKNGADFDLGYPRRHAAGSGSECVFTPTFNGAGDLLKDSAYVLYGFSIDGYDRNAQIRSQWSLPPAAGKLWIGLANWNSERWDWYNASAGAPLNLPGMSDYLGGSGYCVVAVLVTGSTEVRLSSLRIGSRPPSIGLSASATEGLAPLSCDLDASASSDPEGSIVKFEWDLDGDGSFELSGPDATKSVLLSSPQARDISLRVTDNDGVSATRHLRLRAFAQWQHSWGGTGVDTLNECIYDGFDALYACGSTTSFGAGGMDGVVVKFNLAGELQWARSIGRSDTDLANGLCLDGSGNLVVAGSSYLPGNNAMLCCFSPDGALLWGHCWLPGQGLDGVIFTCVTSRAGQIFAGGSISSLPGPGQFQDALLAGFDSSGNLSWFKRLSSSNAQITALTTWAPLLGQPRLYAAGTISSSALLLSASTDSSLNSASYFSGPSVYAVANDLSVSGLTSPDIWLGLGEVGLPALKNSAMLLHYTDSSPECVFFNGGGDELLRGLERRADGSFIIAGSTTSTLPAGDGLLLNISSALQPLAAERFSSGAAVANLEGLDLLGDSAAFCCGETPKSNGCNWSGAAGSLQSSSGAWQDVLATWNSYSPEINSDAELSATALIGVLDSGGGGSNDGLLVVRALPAGQ